MEPHAALRSPLITGAPSSSCKCAAYVPAGEQTQTLGLAVCSLLDQKLLEGRDCIVGVFFICSAYYDR